MFSPELSHGKWCLGAKADQLRRLFEDFWRKTGREREREEREREKKKNGGKEEGRENRDRERKREGNGRKKVYQ